MVARGRSVGRQRGAQGQRRARAVARKGHHIQALRAQENACEANTLMHDQACPISKQPELKACAVIVAPAMSVVKPVEQKQGRLRTLRRLLSPAPR